ncbi:MAG: 4Fe-4S binding protein [bacterium]|nr:4Fe-4S binding protein [bacterium]
MALKRKGYHRLRRTVQTFSVFALNPFFFQYQQLCVPVLNCWSCPGAAFSCPIGAIGQFLARGLVPFIVIGIILLIGAFLGRMLCGWICPFGFLQELLHKIPSKKWSLPDWSKHIKYGVLIILVLLIPIFFGTDKGTTLTAPSNFYYCTFCPAGTLEAYIPNKLGLGQNLQGTAVITTTDSESNNPTTHVWNFYGNIRLGLLGIFLLSFVAWNRPFCRVFCPLGAMFALFNRFSFYQMRVRAEKCTSCYTCKDLCPVDHEIFRDQSSPECIRCLECTACAHNAVNSKEQPTLESVPAAESESATVPPMNIR